MSTETFNLLLSNLSAGPVGVGDPIGKESAENIRRVVRPDGVIVKPDVPILPTDETYLAEAAGTTPPMIASTWTDHDSLRSVYVFAYARQVPQRQQIYQAEDATLSGPLALAANPGYTGTGYADYQNATPYHQEITGHAALPPLPLPTIEQITREEAAKPVALTFSELAAYRACGFAYRLRNLLGFQPFLAPELGYGKAVHHVLREVAEYTIRHGRPPDFQEAYRMLDEGLFLPAASKPAHHQLKEAARHLLRSYLTEYDDDLRRVWETERPFELHLPTAIITGRADVILDNENGGAQSLAIVDYKTSTDEEARDDYALQLAVYTDAGRREGLDVSAAYIHDLKAADRHRVDVSPEAITASEQTVEKTARDLRNRVFRAHPGRPCKRCDVRRLCQWDPAAVTSAISGPV